MRSGASEATSHRSRRWLRRARVAATALGILILLLAAAGAAVEFARMHVFAQGPPGAFYTVDGYRMHLDCTGSGSPTIVLEAGLDDDFLSWRRVQPQLSAVTRVCSYDRAGYGWSSARPGPRDTDSIVAELHGLLGAADIHGPVILMGHSAGGLFIRKYAALYPQGVVGLVFVDASTPTQAARLPKEFNFPDNFVWDKVGMPFGITRLRGDCGVVDPAVPGVIRLMHEHDCTLDVLRTSEREDADFPRSQQEALDTGPFPGDEVLIFSQDPALHFGKLPFPHDVLVSAAQTWNTLQEELKQLSPHNRRIIARGSTHYIQVMRPELVIREVSQLILEVRHDAPPRSDYGSTRTE